MSVDAPAPVAPQAPAAAKRRQTTKATKKRQAIMDSAAMLFGQRGYSEVTLTDIAELADTKAGSMYYYFSSKDELVEEILQESSRRVFSRVTTALEQLPPDASYREKIITAVHAHLWRVAHLDDYSMAHMRIFDQVPEEVRNKSLQLNRRYADVWRKLFDEARDAGVLRADIDLSVVRLLLLGSLSWMRNWYKPGGRRKPREIAEVLTSMFFDGMATKP